MMREIIKGGMLIVILLTGIILQKTGLLDLSGVVSVLEERAHQWWAPMILIGLMTLLFAFALPGSTLMLAAGVMYSPWAATACTVVGGLLGGVAAYYLVRSLSAEWVRAYSESSLYEVMREHAGLLMLCALRMLPGFPHSVINYSAGLLRLPLATFVASTVIGYAVKGFVYTSAVYHATHIEKEAEAFSMETLWPLIALSILLVVGMLVRKRLYTRPEKDGNA